MLQKYLHPTTCMPSQIALVIQRNIIDSQHMLPTHTTTRKLTGNHRKILIVTMQTHLQNLLKNILSCFFFAPDIVQFYSNFVPVLFQFCSIFPVLFQFCSIFPVLFQFCSSFVPVFQFCSSFVPVLFQFCSSFGPVLFQFQGRFLQQVVPYPCPALDQTAQPHPCYWYGCVTFMIEGLLTHGLMNGVEVGCGCCILSMMSCFCAAAPFTIVIVVSPDSLLCWED